MPDSLWDAGGMKPHWPKLRRGMRQSCPRRLGEIGPWGCDEGLDIWSRGHGLVGQGEVGLSCSFCGSLHPDRFMELVRAGWIVGPTDKSYKAYLGRPVTDAERAERRSRWMTGPVARGLRESAEAEGLAAGEIGARLEESWETVGDIFGDSSGQEAKFYFQHLSADQRREFVDLLNRGEMKLGYPGYFYRLPFFVSRPGDAG